MGIFSPHFWQGMSTYPSSHGDSRDESGKEATHQEEETETILDVVGRLAEVESE
jgi:hypothetical protein